MAEKDVFGADHFCAGSEMWISVDTAPAIAEIVSSPFSYDRARHPAILFIATDF